MLTVLGGLAEFERELIRARTTEGRRRAVARGVKLGRRPKLTPHQMKEAITRRDRGEETLREIARSYNVGHPHDFEVSGMSENSGERRCDAMNLGTPEEAYREVKAPHQTFRRRTPHSVVRLDLQPLSKSNFAAFTIMYSRVCYFLPTMKSRIRKRWRSLTR